MIQIQRKSANHLITAYNQMMTEMRNAFDESGPDGKRSDSGNCSGSSSSSENCSESSNDKKGSDMTLQKALDHARREAVHLGEVTAEEAHEIGEYIKRDINDAAEYMMDTSAEFYDWLMLDIEIIERKVIDLFLSVADHTRIELEQFKQIRSALEQTPIYKSGEITGPGTLLCENCGEIKSFIRSDKIADCDKCQHHRFIRRHRKES